MHYSALVELVKNANYNNVFTVAIANFERRDRSMQKAICEMSKEELSEEYLYCVVASQESALDADIRRYFRDRAEVVKRYLEKEKELS